MAENNKNRRLARSAARLAAVQALYQIEMTGDDWRSVTREFDAHRLGAEIEGDQYREADAKFFRTTVEAVISHQSAIDQMTDRILIESWPLGRVDPTLRAVFRSAGAEFLARPDVPVRVVIGEYMDIAKAFFPDGKEPKFVNAVLDKMAHESRPDEFQKKPPEA